jgi:hypothetical protein
MKKYTDTSGHSGVLAYESGPDWIKIQFKTGPEKIYTYGCTKPGLHHVEEMKRLAKEGYGLATYINKYVRDNYEKVENS